jgi:CofD-related protein of GAK system
MSPPMRVTRALRIPDEMRSARCRRLPELGPTILFLSGGTALRELSRTLKRYTHNSIHLVTPFDSGGSSAQLRAAFAMLSIGDLRNRLLALADESVQGHPQVHRLLGHRLPAVGSSGMLGAELQHMMTGDHPLVAEIPAPMRRIIRTHLRSFGERMPDGFDLRGASIGNLVLAGGYMHQDRDMDSVIFLFSKLVQARGTVLPVVDADLHLAARLRDGQRIVGQHLLGGKQGASIRSPVVDLSLVRDLDGGPPTQVGAEAKVLDLIAGADLICFPMGSFYSSIIANLLPAGVGRAIAAADSPKVFLPNTGVDPEQRGLSVADCVQKLVEYVRRDAGSEVEATQVVDFVIVDSRRGWYHGGLDVAGIAAAGIGVIDVPLVTPQSEPNLDPERLAEALIALV